MGASDQLSPGPAAVKLSDGQAVAEAIVVVDVVESTTTIDRYGWEAEGRILFQDLRHLIATVSENRGLRCRKSTGDGYLLTYGNERDADIGVIDAVNASFDLLGQIAEHNANVRVQQTMDVRIAVHFGQVYVVERVVEVGPPVVVERDREGPNVSLTFRLEGIRDADVEEAVDHMATAEFPLRNYVICSQQVKTIVERRSPNTFSFRHVGLFRLKGFENARYDVYLITRGLGDPSTL